MRCALGVLLIGLTIRIVGHMLVQTAGMFLERLTAPHAGEGMYGYIGTALLSIKEVFFDLGYLQWIAPFSGYVIGFTTGVLLIRGPRCLNRPLRRVMA